MKIKEFANNLTQTLKGSNKAQGNWGERILQRVLNASGLQKDRDYYLGPLILARMVPVRSQTS